MEPDQDQGDLVAARRLDVTDAVAESLNQPFAVPSLEMVYRNLCFFITAFQRGEATDVVAYPAANYKWLGVLGRKRKRRPSPLRPFDLRNSPGP